MRVGSVTGVQTCALPIFGSHFCVGSLKVELFRSTHQPLNFGFVVFNLIIRCVLVIILVSLLTYHLVLGLVEAKDGRRIFDAPWLLYDLEVAIIIYGNRRICCTKIDAYLNVLRVGHKLMIA